MDYQEANRLITILKSKPSWFGQEDIDKKLEILRVLKENGAPYYIDALIPLLRTDNLLIRHAAADTVVSLFRKLKSKNELSDRLKYLPIKLEDIALYKRLFSNDVYVNLLAMASFNGNGFLRELALKELANTQSEQAIKYILFRITDWVVQVRDCAKQSLEKFFTPAFKKALIREFELIEILPQTKWVGAPEIHQRIIQFLLSVKLTPATHESLRTTDKAHLLYLKQILAKGADLDLIRMMINDRHFMIRLEGIKYIESFPQEERSLVLEALLKDKVSQVRSRTLYAIKPIAEQYEDVILKLTSDESTSVRDLARYLLKGKSIDFPKIYRERIQQGISMMGSILGLSETGSKDDLQVFKSLMTSDDVRVKVGCLGAIHRHDRHTAVDYSLDLLSHQSGRLRNRCIQIIVLGFNNDALSKVRSLYITGDVSQRRTVLRILNKAGGWNVIGDLMIGVTDPDESVQNMAWSYIMKWRDQSLRLFTTPPNDELERAKEIYSSMDWSKTNKTYTREKLWVDLEFRLR